MFRKFGYFLIIFILLLSFASFAGDIPEGLLYSPTAQVYIGELKKVYNDESVVFAQKVKIKGDFIEGKEIRYYKYTFDGGFEIGKTYLIGIETGVEGAEPWILHVSGMDPGTLEIKEDYDMAKRMQEYINDGSFERSDEMLAKSETDETKETQATEIKTVQSSEEANKSTELKEAKIGKEFLWQFLKILRNLISE